MDCPKCSGSMSPVKYQNIEVDRCRKCQGIFFDFHEHEELKNLEGSEEIDLGDPEIGKKYNDAGKVSCPKCKTTMVNMVDCKQNHIWYEKCNSCHGVYFDAGEFRDFKEENFLDFFKSLWAKERPI